MVAATKGGRKVTIDGPGKNQDTSRVRGKVFFWGGKEEVDGLES